MRGTRAAAAMLLAAMMIHTLALPAHMAEDIQAQPAVLLVFDANGGKIGKKTAVTVKNMVGRPIETAKDPAREKYWFKGWYTKKKGGSKLAPDTEAPAEARTYYAQWKRPDFYIKKNASRYKAYQKANPRVPYETALAYVNSRVDRAFYANPKQIKNDSDILAMPTQNFRLSKNYAPPGLKAISGGGYLRREAAKKFNAMRSRMASEGLTVYPVSAYRSYGTQVYTYNKRVSAYGVRRADTMSARPGHSEHQTGLAVDILQVSYIAPLSRANFQQTKQYKWLCKNAHKYGFILRYPKGYEHVTGYIYEPWHWRYIGVKAASKMKKEGIATFEEYCGRYRPGN